MDDFQKYSRLTTTATVCSKCFQEPNVYIKMDLKPDFLYHYFAVFSHWTDVCQQPRSKLSEIVLLESKECFFGCLLYLKWRGTRVFLKQEKKSIKILPYIFTLLYKAKQHKKDTSHNIKCFVTNCVHKTYSKSWAITVDGQELHGCYS